MKKRYRSWATLVSALSFSFFLAQGAHAASTISYSYDAPEVIKYEDYKPTLFLEHGAMRSDFQLAAHRSHSSHRSHASHASGSYSAPAPSTYSPPSTSTQEPGPKTYSPPPTITTDPSSATNKLSGSSSASATPSKSINSLIVTKPKYSIKLKSGSTWRANLTSKVDDKVELTLEDGMSVWVRSADISQILDSQSGAIVYP
jgi:hypothetical protein